MAEGITVKRFEGSGLVLELPSELYWSNEFAWSNVKASHERGITGSFIAVQSIAKKGVPIILSAPGDMDWASRNLVEALRELAELPDMKLLLTIPRKDGNIQKKVMFDYTQESPISAQPVRGYEAANPEDDFHLTLYFVEVA